MKKSPRVLLLVDWMPDKESLLHDSFKKTDLDCDIMGISYSFNKWTSFYKVIYHWPMCFLGSIRAFGFRNRYDYIIVWQQIMGMFLGLLKLITFLKHPKVFILNATIIERRNYFLNSLRKFFISTSFKKVDHIGFLSEEYSGLLEKRHNIPHGKCVTLKYPIINKEIPDYTGFIPDGYLYSVGLSYRDYSTLMDAARKCRKKFVVATTSAFIKGIAIPDNVTVYRNAFGEAAEKLMKEAAAVILPLENTMSPSGETTLINAMCHGKPVIITETITTTEYITNGYNGILVPWKNSDAIVDAVNLLFSDPQKTDRIGRMARKTVMENHSLDGFSRKVSEIIINDINGAE